MNFNHGLQVKMNEPSTGSVSAYISAVGVIVTSDNADADFFVENEAVSFPDFSEATLAKCGTTGTLRSVVNTLTSQGLEPSLVVVRVPEGADAAELEQNVLAGLDVLKTAANRFGFEIDLLGAPGLESTVVNIALANTAADLGAFAYAVLPADDVSTAITQRASYSQKEMMLLWPATVMNGDNEVQVAALALAARVMIDNTDEDGMGMGKTISNVTLLGGIDDIGQSIDYKAEDSIGNTLNTAHITTLIRKSEDDIRFWGNRTASTHDVWKFETDTRMGQLIVQNIETIFDEEIDVGMTADQLTHIQQLISVDVFNAMIDNGDIIDGQFSLNIVESTEAVMAEGGIVYSFDFGTFKPLEQPVVNGEITNKYLPSILASILN